MTHGQMLVTDGKESVDLYTWHDGHMSDALEMLMKLPFDLFTASKKQKGNDIPTGPWFYDVLSKNRRQKFEDLVDSWDAMIPLQTGVLSVANWIVWRHFNHWNVVPSKDWMSYPHDPADITITVKRPERSRGRLYGYELELAPEDFGKDSSTELVAEQTEGMLRQMEMATEKLNKKLSQAESKITLSGGKELGPNGWKYPKVFVPFDHIVVDLLYQDSRDRVKKKKVAKK